MDIDMEKDMCNILKIMLFMKENLDGTKSMVMENTKNMKKMKF